MATYPSSAIDDVRREAIGLRDLTDVGRLVDLVGNARIVLLGEATHGTEEFHRLRTALSLRLIKEKGFDAIAVEADWPAALRAGRYVKGLGDDADARAALGGFERFPCWMWRNTAIAAMLDALRDHNEGIASLHDRVGLFGLDLYSLRESMHAVVDYLDTVDPQVAQRARARYACFDDLADEPQRYGHAVNFGMRDDCQREVVQQLKDMLRQSALTLPADAVPSHADELFYAQQNARVVQNAETYYRSMFSGSANSWNVRDEHMASTLDGLDAHLARQRGRPARIIVWAHNSHIGDARATDALRRGELNLGQLVRERWHREGETFLLGFSTHTGTVAAASDWDAPVECQRIRPSLPDSVERLMHDSGLGRFALPLSEAVGASGGLHKALGRPLLARAIGVIYRPDSERWSHYLSVSLARQFDALVHIDETRAVQPLDEGRSWVHSAEPEAWPSGI